MTADAHPRDSDTTSWPTTSLEDLCNAGEAFTTCGYVDEEMTDSAPGVVSSTYVKEGRISAPRDNERATAELSRPRTVLEEGDLAVVLVRRVGDSALVTSEHAGWPASRSIGIIRAEPHILQWLHIWLQTHTAKARIAEDVSAHVEPTVSLHTLRRMPFPLPSAPVIARYHEAFSLIEEMTALYGRLARKTVELADVLHEEYSASTPRPETRPLKKVARLKTGKGAERSLTVSPTGSGVDVIAPQDLYDRPVPHVHRFRLSGPPDAGEVHGPDTLMLSTRPDGAHIAVSRRSAIALRSVVALRPLAEEDVWWLLHELRSRSREIAESGQGERRREISARALKGLVITWPDRHARADFHRVAESLHATSRLLVSKIATLRALRDALLHDIAAKAGILRKPTDGEETGSSQLTV
ncbi:hypothetical protein ACHZ98_31825 [Streptomyces sp. MAR4 CNY-716]